MMLEIDEFVGTSVDVTEQSASQKLCVGARRIWPKVST